MLVVVIVRNGVHAERCIVDENVHSPQSLRDCGDLPMAIVWV
jgi:hypothetical protein